MTEHDPEYPVDDDGSSEPIDSCDECETNLYGDDSYQIVGYGLVCGKCAWRLRMRGVE